MGAIKPHTLTRCDMELSKNQLRDVAREIDAEDLPVRTLKEAVLVLQNYHAQRAVSMLNLEQHYQKDGRPNPEFLEHLEAAEALQKYLRLIIKK